jgi:hypothetical protein
MSFLLFLGSKNVSVCSSSPSPSSGTPLCYTPLLHTSGTPYASPLCYTPSVLSCVGPSGWPLYFYSLCLCPSVLSCAGPSVGHLATWFSIALLIQAYLWGVLVVIDELLHWGSTRCYIFNRHKLRSLK